MVADFNLLSTEEFLSLFYSNSQCEHFQNSRAQLIAFKVSRTEALLAKTSKSSGSGGVGEGGMSGGFSSKE